MPPKRAAPRNAAGAAAKKGAAKRQRIFKQESPSNPELPLPPRAEALVPVSAYRPYRYIGVLIPFKNNRTESGQWISDPWITENGFLFVGNIGGVSVVQSVATGKLYANKISKPLAIDGGELNGRKADDAAEEYRISTAAGGIGQLLHPTVVRGIQRTYFPNLALWQKLGDEGDWSLYFDFYNGGSLRQLYQAYRRDRRCVPESFVWHVLLTLLEAVRYLHRGCPPGTDDDGPLGAEGFWRPLYHRDITLDNIFLHYHERPAPEVRLPGVLESNAFPEVILGDFSDSFINGDPPHKLKPGRYNSGMAAEWEDLYAVFQVVKELCIAPVELSPTEFNLHHIPETVRSRAACRVYLVSHHPIARDIFGHLIRPEDNRYSEPLLKILTEWEFRNSREMSVTDVQENTYGERTSNYELLHDWDYVIRHQIPEIRTQNRYWRRHGDQDPEYLPKMDVSWTKPKRLMPYEWQPSPEDPEDETNVRTLFFHGDDDDDDDDADIKPKRAKKANQAIVNHNPFLAFRDQNWGNNNNNGNDGDNNDNNRNDGNNNNSGNDDNNNNNSGGGADASVIDAPSRRNDYIPEIDDVFDMLVGNASTPQRPSTPQRRISPQRISTPRESGSPPDPSNDSMTTHISSPRPSQRTTAGWPTLGVLDGNEALSDPPGQNDESLDEGPSLPNIPRPDLPEEPTPEESPTISGVADRQVFPSAEDEFLPARTVQTGNSGIRAAGQDADQEAVQWDDA
ncbi:hypothetical protein NPX13_g2922 [Xylaria arbuscula]|uniref:EKC/KEOPS complex subunit BUD32 n=1 Tax=Xylaria arbuscula TaxID=114810 RepID=A0A9W8TQ14_9PEZI|nr:hypothetical protein NPX13_g2922 [Xylaria arbuscula]